MSKQALIYGTVKIVRATLPWTRIEKIVGKSIKHKRERERKREREKKYYR